MIGYIRGVLIEKEEDAILLEVQGIGYHIFVPASSLERMPGLGEELQVHTHFHVKEDAMKLYGFLSKAEKEIFKLVIGVGGIGPKGGMGILSTLSPKELQIAVLSGDGKSIAKSPGIGKKTAEKLILELKDKWKLSDALDIEEDDSMEDMELSVEKEAIEAMVALGYSQSESWNALKKIKRKGNETVEEILKKALRELAISF